MKKIECIMKQEKFEAVRDAIRHSGIGGMTSYEVSGFGNRRARGKGLIKNYKIEIYTDDFQLDSILDLIMKTARTGSGETGDGKIAVFDMEKLYRIRTGEEGAMAV